MDWLSDRIVEVVAGDVDRAKDFGVGMRVYHAAIDGSGSLKPARSQKA